MHHSPSPRGQYQGNQSRFNTPASNYQQSPFNSGSGPRQPYWGGGGGGGGGGSGYGGGSGRGGRGGRGYGSPHSGTPNRHHTPYSVSKCKENISFANSEGREIHVQMVRRLGLEGTIVDHHTLAHGIETSNTHYIVGVKGIL